MGRDKDRSVMGFLAAAPRRPVAKCDNDDRLKKMIVFFAAKAPGGKTKLAKYLWEADIEAFRRFGRSLSGREFYVRLEHGPVPHGYEETLRQLRAEGTIVCEFVEKGPFLEERHHLGEAAQVDFSAFTPEEVDVLHTAIERLHKLSARQASERTHDVYWQEVELGDPMSIAAGAVVDGEITEEDLAIAESMRNIIVKMDKKYGSY